MKALFLTILFASFSAAAAPSSLVSLNCKPSKPCAYADDLGKCVASIQIQGRMGGQLIETIQYRPENIANEVLLVPDQYEVSVSASAKSLRFEDETGDQNGSLRRAPGGQFKGHITVDQDFEFSVTCSDQAIGLE